MKPWLTDDEGHEKLPRSNSEASKTAPDRRTPVEVAADNGDSAAFNLLIDAEWLGDVGSIAPEDSLELLIPRLWHEEPVTVMLYSQYKREGVYNHGRTKYSAPYKQSTRIELLDRAMIARKVSIARLLIEGIDFTKKYDHGNKGRTLLHAAAYYEEHKFTQWMIDRGADPAATDSANCTPLHLACRSGYEATIRVLAEESNSVNLLTKDGQTPLHFVWANAHLDSPRIAQFLIDKGADTNAQDKDGIASLHVAAARRNAKAVELLLDEGANARLVDKKERSALHWLVYRKSPRRDPQEDLKMEEAGIMILNMLLAQHPDSLNLECRTDGQAISETALSLAIGTGNWKIAHALRDRGATLKSHHSLLDGLYNAVQTGKKDTVQLLLDLGARANVKENGRDPLLYHVVRCQLEMVEKSRSTPTYMNGSRTILAEEIPRKDYEAITRLLLDAGAALNDTNQDGMTALHMAVQDSYTSGTARILLEHGSDVNVVDGGGNTALHRAAISGHKDFVFWLLDKGTDPNGISHDGHSCIGLAAANGHEAIVQILLQSPKINKPSINWLTTAQLYNTVENEDIEAVRTCLEGSIDIRAADSLGRTVLHKVALNGNEAMAKLLLDKGADVSITDTKGFTSLHLAAIKGWYDLTVLFLDHGANVSAYTRYEFDAIELNKETEVQAQPLHLAAMNGHLEVSRMLLDRGADVHAKLESEHRKAASPLRLAVEVPHLPVVELLVERGDVTEDALKTVMMWHIGEKFRSKGYEKLWKTLVDGVAARRRERMAMKPSPFDDEDYW
jgi:ankyrin repeat protein